jgi:hypothetical protein
MTSYASDLRSGAFVSPRRLSSSATRTTLTVQGASEVTRAETLPSSGPRAGAAVRDDAMGDVVRTCELENGGRDVPGLEEAAISRHSFRANPSLSIDARSSAANLGTNFA